jgi:protein phosphatase
MRYSAGNAQHIGARAQQQDAFGFSDPGDKSLAEHGGLLGVVADGMGGLTNGSEASSAAVRSFLQAYKLKTATESIADALTRSLQEANRAVLQVAGGGEGGVGTTLAAAVIHNDSVHWIAAGDSRIYWLHDVILTRLNAEHIYALKLNRQAAEGKISRAEAAADPERASLTSYLGQPGPELVDHNKRPLTVHPDDCVILCSDGLYRGVGESEMVSAFHHDLQRGCDFLVHRVLSKQRNQQDNLTIIALKAGASSRSTGRHPARTALLILMALLLVSLSGSATYWYLRRPATVEQKPAAGKPSAPDLPINVSGQPNPTKRDATGTETKQPQPQPDTKAAKASGSKKEKPQPAKRGISPEKPKPAHRTPDNQGPGETKTATPSQETVPPPASQQTPEPGGVAVTPPPTSSPSEGAGQESPSGESPDSEQDKKTTSPPASPKTKPNSTKPPPSNANPPDPKSNPPNPNLPNPNPPNLATATADLAGFVGDNSSGPRNADLTGETKGPESLCRS